MVSTATTRGPTSPMEASAYSHPTTPGPYRALREKLVEQIVAQGYDFDSLTEIPVDFSLDQDSMGHVTNPIYGRYASAGNLRLFESFAGKNFRSMVSGRDVGPMLRGYQYDLRRPTSYPDAVIVGNRVSELRLDRYFTTTTIWSLRQQVVVAEMRGWIVFVDPRTGRPVDLVQRGEPYATLWKQMEEKVKVANDRRQEWEAEQSTTKKPRL